MGGSAHASYGTGFAVLAGGLYAFAYKNSLRSLVASSILSQAFLFGGYLIDHDKHLEGHQISLASSLCLVLFGSYRLGSTKRMMPSVPILVLGSASSAYQIKKVLEWMQ